jgi:hypothetical protein
MAAAAAQRQKLSDYRAIWFYLRTSFVTRYTAHQADPPGANPPGFKDAFEINVL